MRDRMTTWLSGLLAAVMLLATPALAQRGDGQSSWVLLGQQKVGFFHDRDVVIVDPSSGWLRSLRLVAENNDVHMENVRVVYQNGFTEDFRIDGLLREGQQSEPIDLRGERSFIDRIELKYRTRVNFEGLATVKVYGEKVRDRSFDRPPPTAMPLPTGRWEKIGEQSVRMGGDRDVIRIGRQEGTFVGVLLRVRQNDIEMRDVTVIYGNGERDSLNVRRVIRAGTHTGLLDLRGRARMIDRVELSYRSLPNFRGEASVELWALHAPDRDRAPAYGNDWSLLGQQTVGFRADRDIINIERGDGAVSKLRIHVARNDVYFESIRLTYQNGYTEDLRIGRLVKEGTYSDLDLRGARSYLKQIALNYRARQNFEGNAVVRVFGQQSRFGGGSSGGFTNPAGRWETLGRQSVGFSRDRDVIQVGRSEGRFDAIVLRATGNDVEMLDLKIIYSRGDAENVALRRILRAGTQSDVIKIEGNRGGRRIDRIEMSYRSRPGFRGEAEIEVLGRQSN